MLSQRLTHVVVSKVAAHLGTFSGTGGAQVTPVETEPLLSEGWYTVELSDGRRYLVNLNGCVRPVECVERSQS